MSVDKDIAKFEAWALSMGCPREAIPPRNAMRRIFQSGQALAFHEMMRRVRPAAEIQKMKDTILVHKMKKIMESGLPPEQHRNVPKELQNWMAVEKLKTKIENAEAEMKESKEKYLRTKALVKADNVERMKHQEKLSELQAKVAMLQQKECAIKAELEGEKAVAEHIRSAAPLKIDGANASEAKAKLALQAAIEELKSYYLKCDENGDATPEDRDALWDKMHTIFADVPNYMLWKSLCAMKDRQLVDIGVMSQLNIAELLQVNDDEKAISGSGANSSGYKIAVGKMYALHVSIMVDMHLGRIEKNRLLNEYTTVYDTFLLNVRRKYAMFNKEDIPDELLHMFVVQFSTECFKQAQIEYLERTLKENKTELLRQSEALKDHKLLMNQYRCICKDIEELYCKTQEDLRSLSSVKEKVKTNEEYLTYMMERQHDANAVKILNGVGEVTGSSDNSTFASDDSFVSSATDNTLSTTVSSNRPDIVISRVEAPMVVPPLLKEFKLFLELPMAKLKRNLSVENALQLEENPLCQSSILATIPESMHQFLPSHSMTSAAFISHIRTLLAWKQKLEMLLTASIPSKEVNQIDFERLADMKRRQIEEITKLLDETARIGEVNDVCLQRVAKYIEFLKANPLRKFVPKTRLFNGRSYQEYEDEFMMYYNIVLAQREQQQH